MERKEVTNTVTHHVIAWVLLLTFGIGAIAAGIAITANGYQNRLIVIDSGDGGLSNVVFFLIGISVAFALYILRGFTARTWSTSPVAVIIILTCSVVLLALGVVGLYVIPGVGLAAEIGKRLLRYIRFKDGA